MTEPTYWLWNGKDVEGPVTRFVLNELSVKGQLLPEAKVMAVDSQEWKTLQEHGEADQPPLVVHIAGGPAKPIPSNELNDARKPSLIEKIGAAFAALVVGLGAIIAGISKLVVSVKGLFVATAVAAAHEGHALESLRSDSRAEESSSSSLFRPHAHGAHSLWDWYWSHQALINEILLVMSTLVCVIIIDRLFKKRVVIISKNLFRIVVGVSLFFLTAWVFSNFLEPLPEPLSSFINAPENSMPSSLAVIEALFLLAMLVSYVGLFFIKRWGRLLFACSVSVVLITSMSSGPLVEPASAQFFGTLSDISCGVVLALAYLTPLFQTPRSVSEVS